MIKTGTLHIPAHIQLHLARLIGRNCIGDYLKGQDGYVSCNKASQAA